MLQIAYFVDPIVGKVDKNCLSQRMMVELFIEGIENKHIWYFGTEAPDDLKEWAGLTLNADGNVVAMELQWVFMTGSIDTHWLPPTITRLNLSVNNLVGSVDMTVLPELMDLLDLSFNEFSGTLDFTKLPNSLSVLILHHNKFFGKADFSQIPRTLRRLNVGFTDLSGDLIVHSGMKYTIEKSKVQVVGYFY